MKAIIDGKLYDTETATELGKWPRLPPGTAALYRTSKGSYFAVVLRDNPPPLVPRKRIYPVEDEWVVPTVIKYGGVDEALRLFPDRIEVA